MTWIRRYKTKLTSKISVDSNFTFSSYACSITLIDYCVELSLIDETFLLKIALIPYWNYFSPSSFGEKCFLEVSYEKMQKIQILTILRGDNCMLLAHRP